MSPPGVILTRPGAAAGESALSEISSLLATGYVRLLTTRGQDRSEIAPACRFQIVLDSPAQQRDELSMRTPRRA